MKHPIALILPTRNAMPAIESHLHAIRDLLSEVEQIIVVDSSEDGTLDYLRKELDGLPAQFFARPRGLYESWNFAVRQATAEFVYFSTMGDTISREGMSHLLEIAREHSADVVLSPPEMWGENGEPRREVQWPVHILCEKMLAQPSHTLSPVEALLHAVSYLPATILGSSASNLYRRTILTENPFPEGWGHCADSAWMVSQAMKARFAVTTKPVARFVLHAKEDGGTGHLPAVEHYEDFFARAERSVENSNLGAGEREILAGWLAGFRSQREKNIQAIEARNRRLHHYEGKIEHLTKRVTIVSARVAEYEDKLRASNAKVVAAREQLWDYERAHRSLLRMIRLYVSVKLAMVRKAFDRLNQGKPERS